MNTLDVLKAAKAEIEKGWYQGGFSDGRDKVCALGALRVGAGGQIQEDGHVSRPYCVEARMAVDDAITKLSRVIPGGQLIVDFNDSAKTTKDDVLAVFDRAIASLEATPEVTE